MLTDGGLVKLSGTGVLTRTGKALTDVWSGRIGNRFWLSRNSVIPQRNNENFICFQSVPLEKVFPAIPQRNNGNFICFQSVSFEKMFQFHLLSISSTQENVSRNSAVPQFRNSAVEQRKFYLLSIRGGPSHFSRLRLRSCSKIFESESGNFLNLRIRLLFRLRLLL